MQVLTALLGVVVGAVLTNALQFFFWKRQHRQELQSLEERESRRAKTVAAEKLREIAVLLIELGGYHISGPHISNTEVSTTFYIETLRLRRELEATTLAARELFPNRAEAVTAFTRTITQGQLSLTPESAGRFRTELDALLASLR